jgi:hypothetical protein
MKYIIWSDNVYEKEWFYISRIISGNCNISSNTIIAIPSISSMLKNVTISAFESDAKMLLKQVEYARLNNSSFDPTTINTSNLSNYNISNKNYETISVSIIDNKPYIYVKGKNKWDNLTACGTQTNIYVLDSTVTSNCIDFNYVYLGNYKTFIAPLTGTYTFEAWGASGGGSLDQTVGSHAGLGGYTKGNINLNAGEKIYVYVGGSGFYTTTDHSGGGYNGGGSAGSGCCGGNGGGGGATDFRLVNGVWNNSQSLYSRIMVSGAGGGNDNDLGTFGGSDDGSGGAGGGLNGENAKSDGVYSPNTGGTQILGVLGVGQSANVSTDTGGAGGGYRGGIATNHCNGGGGGGSSFISGYTGCDAINSSGINTGQPNHYSGKIFTNMQMIDGNSSMPNPDGGTETGHSGNGYARITYIGV